MKRRFRKNQKESGPPEQERRSGRFFSNFKTSLSTWLTTYILLIALIPVLLISVANFIFAQRTLTNESTLKLEQEISQAALELEVYLAQFPDDLLVLSDAAPVEAIFRALENDGIDPASLDTYGVWVSRLTQYLASTVENKPDYHQIRLLDADGNEIVRVDSYDNQVHIPWEDELINSAGTGYFQRAKQLAPGQVYVSTILVNREYPDVPQLQVPVMRYSTPIFDNGQQFRGVLTTSVHAESFARRLQANLEGTSYLANPSGYYLYQMNADGAVQFLRSRTSRIVQDFPQLFVDDAIHEEEDAHHVSYLDSVNNQFVTIEDISFDANSPNRHWELILTVPSEELISASLLARIAPFFLLGVVVAAVAILSGIRLSRTISQPIAAVSHAATALAEASININSPELPQTRIDVHRQDELGELADSFNRMTVGLGTLYQTLDMRLQGQKNLLEMLTTSGQISEQITTILDQSELVETVLPLLKEKYNLYHAAVLLLDENGSKLNFAYGSDTRARQLQESRESIPLRHPHSLIARAARAQAFVLVNDVATEPNYLPHPLIKDTRSELAIPLMVHNRLIGVLDIQENVVGRFKEEDISLFVSIGRQLSIAINNAQLFEKFQKSERQLSYALEKAIQSDKAKDEFLARVSHELRTPLGVILGYAEMMQDEMYGDVTEAQSERLDDIIDSSSHLTDLVNQLLDSAKLDSGKIVPEHKPFELYDLIHTVAKQMDILAKQKGLTLHVKYARTLPTYINSDATLIRQMLINLIGNAIKFTDQGEIIVGVVHKDEKWMEMIVKDTGIGIPASFQQTIFEPFRQVDDSITRTHGGAGLGLAITKRIAEIMGGGIRMVSREGVGSQFTILLPLEIVSQLDLINAQANEADPIGQALEMPEFESGSELEPIILSRD